MIVPTFRTWTAGEVITAAELNSNVRDAGNFWLAVPVFEGRQTVVQSIGNNINTRLLFDAEDIDSDNGHSTVTNTGTYTPQTPGRFLLAGGYGYAANANGVRTTAWALNNGVILGSTQQVQAITSGPTNGRVTPGTLTQWFNGTSDIIELWAFQNSGAPLNTDNSGGGQSRMSVRWVGIA